MQDNSWLSKMILNDFSTVLAWPEVAAVETAAAAAEAAETAVVAEVARSPAVGWACTFGLAVVEVAAESPKVTAFRIIRRALRQCGAGRRRRRRCTQQEPCWARGWLTLARPPPSRPSGRCRIKVGRVNLLNSRVRERDVGWLIGLARSWRTADWFLLQETKFSREICNWFALQREISLINRYFVCIRE